MALFTPFTPDSIRSTTSLLSRTLCYNLFFLPRPTLEHSHSDTVCRGGGLYPHFYHGSGRYAFGLRRHGIPAAPELVAVMPGAMSMGAESLSWRCRHWHWWARRDMLIECGGAGQSAHRRSSVLGSWSPTSVTERSQP